MTTGHIGFEGHTPQVTLNPIDPSQKSKPRGAAALTEKQVYEKMWTVENYRKVSPGELAANQFINVAKPNKDDEIIDFGCGTGRGGFMLCFMGNMNVTMTDFASNCLDDDVKLACKNFPEKIRFIEQDLNDTPTLHSKYGYCTCMTSICCALNTEYEDDYIDPNEIVVPGPYGAPWPEVIETKYLDIGDSEVSIRIEDENAKMPAAWALNDHSARKRATRDAIENFCEWMQVDSESIEQLQDDFERIAKVKRFYPNMGAIVTSKTVKPAKISSPLFTQPILRSK